MCVCSGQNKANTTYTYIHVYTHARARARACVCMYICISRIRFVLPRPGVKYIVIVIVMATFFQVIVIDGAEHNVIVIVI